MIFVYILIYCRSDCEKYTSSDSQRQN